MNRIILAMLLSGLTPVALALEPFALKSEKYTLQVGDAESGEVQTRSIISIERKEGAVHFVEDRRSGDIEPALFRMTLDPASMLPVSWDAAFGGDGEKTHVELSVLDDCFEVSVRKGDAKPEVRKVKKPKEPFVVTPLLKYYLARCVESGAVDRKFMNVGVRPDGSVNITEVEVKDGGEVDVEVPAGKFRCRRLVIGPASRVLAAVVPDGEMYLAVEGTHPLVKATARATRFSPVMVTELDSYSAEE